MKKALQNKGFILFLSGLLLGTVFGYCIKKEKTETYVVNATANLNDPDLMELFYSEGQNDSSASSGSHTVSTEE